MLRRLLAAAPDVGLAVAYFLTALDPERAETTRGLHLYRAALLEFFAVHAAGFLKVIWVMPDWDRTRRAQYVAILAGAYSTVLATASLIAGAWWPLLIFWSLTANRTLDAVARGAPGHDTIEAEANAWAGNTALFVMVAAVAGMIGMDRTTVLVAAGVYFAANAASALAGWWWAGRWFGRRRRSGWLPGS